MNEDLNDELIENPSEEPDDSEETEDVDEPKVSLEKSILSSTKKSLGINPEFEEFDPDIIMCINSALNILTQLGVGPKEGFQIETKDQTWDQFIGENLRLNMTKSYVFMKTKVMFDPPTTSSVLESYKEMIKEYECRLNYEVDPIETFE